MMPLWVEASVAVLLVLSSVFALIGAIGLLRMKDFFQRMHPPALASTLGAWCVALASIIYFSVLKSAPVLHGWLIPILLSITVPVTTLLLARTALFRKRMAGTMCPPRSAAAADRPGAHSKTCGSGLARECGTSVTHVLTDTAHSRASPLPH